MQVYDYTDFSIEDYFFFTCWHSNSNHLKFMAVSFSTQQYVFNLPDYYNSNFYFTLKGYKPIITAHRCSENCLFDLILI